MEKVVIVSGVRTLIGSYGGRLEDIPVFKLGSIVLKYQWNVFAVFHGP